MQRCIDLALYGAGSVSPNPMVGAVLVVDGMIIAEGYHQKCGQSHAEVNAIESALRYYPDAEERLRNATMYVSLEPCAHFGKTPPCTDLIIRYQISQVVIGCRDRFDQVNGKGVSKLRAAGIKVIENVLETECLHLNRRFLTRIQKQRPFIILKWAQTSNGFFAPLNGGKRWITSFESKKLVHRWRSEEDAVMVGKNTALIDNPQLNVRLWEGKNPVRIVIDRNLQLPVTLNLFDHSQPTIIFNSKKTAQDGNVKYLELENFDNYLPQLICYQLYLMDIQSVLIEGGAETLNLFMNAGLWDEARVFTSNDIWEDGIPAPILSGRLASSDSITTDTLQIWFNA